MRSARNLKMRAARERDQLLIQNLQAEIVHLHEQVEEASKRNDDVQDVAQQIVRMDVSNAIVQTEVVGNIFSEVETIAYCEAQLQPYAKESDILALQSQLQDVVHQCQELLQLNARHVEDLHAQEAANQHLRDEKQILEKLQDQQEFHDLQEKYAFAVAELDRYKMVQSDFEVMLGAPLRRMPDTPFDMLKTLQKKIVSENLSLKAELQNLRSGTWPD